MSEMVELSPQQRLIALLASEQELLRRMPWGNMDRAMSPFRSASAALSDLGIANGAADAKKWVQQVTEISRDVEELLDETRRSSGSGSCGGGRARGLLSTLAPTISVFLARRRMAKQLKHINSRIDAIKLRLSLLTNLDDRESPANPTRYRMDDRQLEPLSVEEVEALGVDSRRREVIIGWLSDGAAGLKAISVVGTAGVGKTTLVRSVYNEPQVRGRFRCHAWVTVGAASSAADLLRRIMLQVFLERPEMPANADAMEVMQLADTVGRYLRDKAYLVVLDDVWSSWSSEIWDYLGVALPDNGLGSRLILSSRVPDIGRQCRWPSAVEIFDHSPLDPRDSMVLFCRKAFRSADAVCPPDLKAVAAEIVRECHGLPLLLVAMGELMSTKGHAVPAWESVVERLRRTKELHQLTLPVALWFAYNDLPSRLKACFLYFALFPRTYCAKRTALIRLWIAEGFVEKEAGRAPEDTAEEYLRELIRRNLVQAAEHYDYGKVKSCGVHDMFREIIIHKSEEENFGTSVAAGKAVGANVRRLSVTDAKEDVLGDVTASSVRTLFVLGASSAASTSSFLASVSEYKLLRVLDLEGAPVDRLPDELPDGLHLRYLSLRNTRISKLPRSVRKLTHLQTLDLKGTYVQELPSGITRLQNIRHLLAYRYYSGRHPPYYYALGVTLPQGVGQLRELQKLTYVEATRNNGTLTELGRLTQLKRLGIVKLRRGDGACLCSSVAKMAELLSLSASSTHVDEPLDIGSLDPAPPRLERLYLRGPSPELPRWIFSLRNLVRIRLRWSRLSEDSIKNLQTLPVIELALIQAYDGVALHFSEGFSRLQILEIDHLTNLERMSFGAAMPKIHKMSIRSCGKLISVPDGVEGLKHLKEIHLFAMPEAMVSSLRKGGADYKRVELVPVIRVYNEHRDISSENL